MAAPPGERLLLVLAVNGLPEIGSGFHRMHPLCSKQCHIVLIGVTLLTPPPPAVPQLTMLHNVPWSPSSYRVPGLWIRVLQIPMCRSIRRRSFTCTVWPDTTEARVQQRYRPTSRGRMLKGYENEVISFRFCYKYKEFVPWWSGLYRFWTPSRNVCISDSWVGWGCVLVLF